MVNYCCVKGCGRNSRVHRHLYYYSIPKERDRQEQWLTAAGKIELLEQVPIASLRFCSRHFEPNSLKNKHLSATAFPSLNLPGPSNNEEPQDPQAMKHDGVVCNGCHEPIVGFRYKCIICTNYDNCQKCEMLEMHPEHPMIRIPKPLKHIKADDLTARWRRLITEEEGPSRHESRSAHTGNDSSSDDEPINKYAKGYDSGVDLSEDVKRKIRDEVSRVMDLADGRSQKDDLLSTNSKKRAAEEVLKPNKKARSDDSKNVFDTVGTCGVPIQELAFADVGEFKLDGEIKNEARGTNMYDGSEADGMLPVELRSNFSQMMVKVSNSDEFIMYHDDKNENQ